MLPSRAQSMAPLSGPSPAKHAVAAISSRLLGPFGFEVRDRLIGEMPEGFPSYLEQARAAGMDVNDYEEERLGWKPALPTLEEIAFPYLREESRVCELGPGTGRWSRHLLARVPSGELHLVDRSPWMIRFLADYFRGRPNLHVHLGDGLRLPMAGDDWLDLAFVAHTFEAFSLGVIRSYLLDFARVLKPGGHAVFDYIDPTVPDGWAYLENIPAGLEAVHTFHSGEVIDRVAAAAGLEVMGRHQVGKNTFVTARKPA